MTMTTLNPTNNNMPVRIHCVSFDLQPDILDILPRSDFSAEEIDDSWYCRLELEAMTAAAMDPANERNLQGGGSRGLEKYTTAGSTRLEVHRVQVVAAVLREQKRQKETNQELNQSDVLLAAAAAVISQECQELACIQGYNDELEAYAGAPSIITDVVSLPKPGLFSGFSKQLRAIQDLAFLERESKHSKPTSNNRR